MLRAGVILIIISIVSFILLPISAIFFDTNPNESLITSAVALGIIGGLLTLGGVIKDRYNEYKEDQQNDDYRKY